MYSPVHFANAIADVTTMTPMTPDEQKLFAALRDSNVKDLVAAVVKQIDDLADTNLKLEVGGKVTFEFAQIVNK